MQSNIIKILCDSYPEFKLFWDTHFEIIPFDSLVPEFDDNMNPVFTKELHIKRRELTPEDKVAFYERDIILWREIQLEQREKGDQDE